MYSNFRCFVFIVKRNSRYLNFQLDTQEYVLLIVCRSYLEFQMEIHFRMKKTRLQLLAFTLKRQCHYQISLILTYMNLQTVKKYRVEQLYPYILKIGIATVQYYRLFLFPFITPTVNCNFKAEIQFAEEESSWEVICFIEILYGYRLRAVSFLS